MKYNPLTNELLTNDGMLLKKLHCPFTQQWEAMIEATPAVRICDHCSKAVHDTAPLNEDEVQQLITDDAHACFKVNLNQDNLTITYNNHA